MIDLNQPEIQALKQSIQNILDKYTTDDDESEQYTEEDRDILVGLFVKYLNALQFPVSELGNPERCTRLTFLNDSPVCQWRNNDNAVTLKNVIIKNAHPDAEQTVTEIDVYIWLDGVMQATVYNEDLGGLYDPCRGRNVIDVLENPGIIMDQVRMTIYQLENELDDEYDDDSEF